MTLLDFLASSPLAWIVFVGILSLMIGSFLNVVIHRLPIMMERDWAEQCSELAGQQQRVPQAPYTLSTPRSSCPHCGHFITAIENIPVLSYIFLGGKCRSCRAGISLRYPTVEAITAILSSIVAWQFGFSWLCAGALLVTWFLIALTFIDFDHQLLPDSLTLFLLWSGLFFNLFHVFTDLNSSVIGAMAGYLSLWSIYHLFKLVTGKEGMGYGDFKLLAALGAWLGWQALPMIVLLSSFVGAIVGIMLILTRQLQRDIPIPFGPYLAAAGWIAMLWGSSITEVYFEFAGLA
jgi:leader peptidase (prepilin peptidase)/N-methyltransferase